MSELEDLKSRFLVSNNLSEARMLALLQIAVEHCAVDTRGCVEIKKSGLSNRDKVMLILTARFIAHHLDESIAMDVIVEELVRDAMISPEQVRARASELLREKLIESPSRGTYRALIQRIEPFLRQLGAA